MGGREIGGSGGAGRPLAGIGCGASDNGTSHERQRLHDQQRVLGAAAHAVLDLAVGVVGGGLGLRGWVGLHAGVVMAVGPAVHRSGGHGVRHPPHVLVATGHGRVQPLSNRLSMSTTRSRVEARDMASI